MLTKKPLRSHKNEYELECSVNFGSLKRFTPLLGIPVNERMKFVADNTS